MRRCCVTSHIWLQPQPADGVLPNLVNNALGIAARIDHLRSARRAEGTCAERCEVPGGVPEGDRFPGPHWTVQAARVASFLREGAKLNKLPGIFEGHAI